MAKPRPPLVRGLLAGSLVLAIVGGWLALRHGLVIPLVGDGPLGDVLSLIYPVVTTGALASFVSYRFMDGAAWLLPPLGLALVVRVAWRIALLPYRDWPPRSEEVSRDQEVR